MKNRQEELYCRLNSDAIAAAAAANELLEQPEWTLGSPPDTLIQALRRASLTYDAESAVFELGRVWERAPLSRALMAAFKGEQDPRARTCAAWLLKQLSSPTVWRDMAATALSYDEGPQTRRWLLEGLDRLAFVGDVGWDELRELVYALRQNSEPHIRDGVVGILMSLPPSDEKTRLLLDMLRDFDASVLASALSALSNRHQSFAGADLTRLRALSRHPDLRVSLVARELLERIDADTGAAGSDPEGAGQKPPP